MSDEASPLREAGSARILIADDHPLYREALGLMLRQAPDLKVAGEAADGREAIEDGLAATRAIKRDYPRTIVLIITSFEDTGYLMDAIRAGAAGYVLKVADKPQIIDAIRGVLRGESLLNQELAMRLLRRLVDEATKEEESTCPVSRARTTLPESLTQREVEVLRLLVGGRTNHEIARGLSVSVSTAKKHVHSVIDKLGVSDRTHAAVRAMELGLLPNQG